MRHKLASALAATLLTLTGVAGSAASTVAAAPTVRDQADALMSLPYERFAVAPHDPPFNWSTDGCSVPTGYAPYSNVFRPACVQHDFGYRNYGARFALRLDPTRAAKDWIDGRFRTEMHRVCDHTYDSAALAHLRCANAAESYYVAVHLAGDRAFFG
ncbi:phospholipase A2 [Streptomyces sp. NPDC046805]|uniref:phospholipase A2 n=1 Tax=Streptomyces sp. NPDC046805 TaxID=3155134 RepID=UPI0033D5F463